MHGSAHVSRPKRTSPHQVRIELDRPEATYQPGEPITGRVTVHANANEVCEALTLELQLCALGEMGTLMSLAEQRLFAGELRAGETKTLPFEIQAPRGARLYAGHLFKVEARLAVVLVSQGMQNTGSITERLAGVSMDVVRARAYPVAAQPIWVPMDARPITVNRDPREDTGRLSRGGSMIVGAVLALIGVILAAVTFGVYMSADDPILALIPGILSALLGLVGGGIFLTRFPVWMAERKVGAPEIAVRATGMGEYDVLVRIANAPGASAKVELKIGEAVAVPRGEDRQIETKLLLTEPHALHAIEPGVFGARLRVPANVPPSIHVGSAAIAWRLDVTIQLPLWPDWHEQVRLTADPGGERQSTSERLLVTFDIR